jgi:CIC family chloride channel protein
MVVAFQYALQLVGWVFDPTRVPWYLIFLFPAAGGLLVGLIIPHFAQETAGQGMDEVIRAVHFEGGRIRSIVPPVKILVSALTIGSGGSAGPEGPVGEIGAGAASIMGGWLHLRRGDLRTLVIAGAAAGFGAIFKAPLGGALFALETPYKNDMEHGAVVPALISSTTAYFIFVLFFGTAPIFGFLAPQPFPGIADLGLYLLLGLLSGLVATLFVKVFFRVSDVFARASLPFWAKTTLGGLGAGALAVCFPQVLGLGYDWDRTLVASGAQAAIVAGQVLFGVGVLLVVFAAILAVKALATSLTIGSGGSGGVMTPSIFLGGTLGAVVGLVVGLVFSYPSPATLVVVGMGAVLAAGTKTPISSAIIITEMTGGYTVLIPLILATVVAYTVAGENTLYQAQITRKSLPLDLGALSGKSVRDVMTKPVEFLSPELSVEEAYKRVATRGHYSYPVVDPDGRIIGIVYRKGILDAQKTSPKSRIRRLLQTHYEVINDDAPAVEAFEVMNGMQVTRMYAVDGNQRLVGVLTRFDLLRAMDALE